MYVVRHRLSEHRLLERSASLAWCHLSTDRHGATFTATLIRHSVSASCKPQTSDLNPTPNVWLCPWTSAGLQPHTHTNTDRRLWLLIFSYSSLSGSSSLQPCDICFYVCFGRGGGGHWLEWFDDDDIYIFTFYYMSPFYLTLLISLSFVLCLFELCLPWTDPHISLLC